MSKQERAAKASKKADAQAARIVAEGIKAQKAKGGEPLTVDEKAAIVDKVAKPKRGGEPTDEERQQAETIKAGRDAGKAWWLIAHEMGLPGSAPSVAQGKGGASRARAIYKRVLGDYPRKQRMRQGNDETQAVANGTRRRNRQGNEVVKAAPGQPVFADSVSDEEVIAAIRGKQIEWEMYRDDAVSGKPEFVGMDEQIVHESAAVTMRRDKEGFRYVTFREGQGNDVPVELRGYKGKHRSVFVHSIVKVAGTGRRVQTEEVVAAQQERTAKKRARRVARKTAGAK